MKNIKITMLVRVNQRVDEYIESAFPFFFSFLNEIEGPSNFFAVLFLNKSFTFHYPSIVTITLFN